MTVWLKIFFLRIPRPSITTTTKVMIPLCCGMDGMRGSRTEYYYCTVNDFTAHLSGSTGYDRYFANILIKCDSFQIIFVRKIITTNDIITITLT